MCACVSVGSAMFNLICICVVATPIKFAKLMKKRPSVLPTFVGSACGGEATKSVAYCRAAA